MKEHIASFLRFSICPSGLITSAGIVLCVSTILGFMGQWSWFLDLFSCFRVQYLLGLALLGGILLPMRQCKTAAAFLAFACINLCVVAPFYFSKPRVPPESTNPIRAMLLNVNTQRGDPKRVLDAIQKSKPDIIVLEEISSRWMRDLQVLTNSYPYACIRPRDDNFGIGLFSKFPLEKSEVIYIGGAQVPSILATTHTDQGRLRVVATHPLPPLGHAYAHWRNDQLARLPGYTRSPLPLVLLGDLNAPPWNSYFKRLLRRSGLIDSSKGRGIQPTWPSNNPLLLIPIDHFLHSSEITVVDKKIGANVGSDHYPVIVDFVIGPKPVEKP